MFVHLCPFLHSHILFFNISHIFTPYSKAPRTSHIFLQCFLRLTFHSHHWPHDCSIITPIPSPTMDEIIFLIIPTSPQVSIYLMYYCYFFFSSMFVFVCLYLWIHTSLQALPYLSIYICMSIIRETCDTWQKLVRFSILVCRCSLFLTFRAFHRVLYTSQGFWIRT